MSPRSKKGYIEAIFLRYHKLHPKKKHPSWTNSVPPIARLILLSFLRGLSIRKVGPVVLSILRCNYGDILTLLKQK